jgi:hypothetical protein
MFEFSDFEIALDWSWISNLGTQPLHLIMWHFFINGGWVLLLMALIYGAWISMKYFNSARWGAKQTFVFLAIDIPRENIQTPRAVENIFATIAGAHTPLEWGEKVFEGKYQLGFSFEIVSIDGYVQFIIMSPTGYRNLVEASIYSQYPDAEITEVEDYMKDLNVTFPNDEYNIWGTDLVMVNKDYYPLRSYKDFLEEVDKEFKDPMAALLEIMNTIGPGEQIWFQIIIIPANNDWMEAGRKAINKIMSIPEKTSNTIIDKILNVPLGVAQIASEQLTGSPLADPAADSKDKFDINRLTPIEKTEVESIADKIDKINFDCKVRYCYFGKKEVFKKGLGVSGVMGAVKQYTSTGLNALKPGKNKTTARLLFAKYRLAYLQNRIFNAHKDRNPDTTVGTYTLSVEELATMWHFPYIEVKAPLVAKIDAKRGSAPIGLPLDDLKPKSVEEIPVEAPTEDVKEPVIDYDNNYFEERFAIDKTGTADKARKKKLMKEMSGGKSADEFADRAEDAPEVGSGFGVEDIIVDQYRDRRDDAFTPLTPEEVAANKEEESVVEVENKIEEDKDSKDLPSNLPLA